VIDRLRNRGDVGISLLTENFVASRVDGDDAAGVTVFAEIALGARSVLAGIA